MSISQCRSSACPLVSSAAVRPHWSLPHCTLHACSFDAQARDSQKAQTHRKQLDATSAQLAAVTDRLSQLQSDVYAAEARAQEATQARHIAEARLQAAQEGPSHGEVSTLKRELALRSAQLEVRRCGGLRVLRGLRAARLDVPSTEARLYQWHAVAA